MKRAIKRMNALFSSLLLILFYLFIIPFGKLIFLLNSLLQKKNPNTFWLEPGEQKGDLSSPY